MVKVKPEEFKVLSGYIHNISGIYLDSSKVYLVETRLGNLLKDLGCASFSDLHQKAQADASKRIQNKIIDAITTGETLFFRDAAPFELLQHKILPDLIDRKKKSGLSVVPIRIWSAACSSGQEIYSVAIVLKELLGDLSRYQIRLLGTDISDEAIARASYGHYNQFEIERGLPRDKLTKYFTQMKGEWKIRDEIRALATFRKINLMDNFITLGKFDIILCRNVAIYFTDQERIKLFKKLEGNLEQKGYLVIGSTESLMGIAPQFEPQRYLRSVFYQSKT
jgi:chemotaxis protein methyltransferase CheR